MIPLTELTLTRDVVIILHASVVLYSLLFFGTFFNQWARSKIDLRCSMEMRWINQLVK